MVDRFHFGAWTYRSVNDITPDEVDIWANSGMTATMSPEVSYRDTEKLIPFLDRAQERNMKLIAVVGSLDYSSYTDEETYKQRFTQAYEKIKGHPALMGFYCGDEPKKPALENTIQVMRIQKMVAPELQPYINLRGSTPDMFSEKPGDRFADWLKRFKAETGCDTYCWDSYSQMVNDGGATSHICALKAHNDACREAGVRNWVTLLSSAHWVYKYPNEYEFMWQITTAAAAGCQGVIWFRLYDKALAPDYHGSPIDEFGNLTEQYHRMKRCQRRFNDQFGLIMHKLQVQATYLTGFPRLSFEMFNDKCHDVIKKLNIFEQCMISFFKDEEDKEYVAFVNIERELPAIISMEFDSNKATLVRIDQNGKNQRRLEDGDDMLDLFPGQMLLYRIDRK